MKNGFVSIPIIIAIVIGTALVGGAGYVGVQQYQKSEEQKALVQLQQETEGGEIQKLREELELLREKQETSVQDQKNQEKPEPQVIEKVVERVVEKPVVVSQSPSPLPTQTQQSTGDLKITSVNIIPHENYLRIEWKTNKPSESKIFIWPFMEPPGHTSFPSPSKSTEHYANINYSDFPIYPKGNGQAVNNYFRYGYRIEATSEELFADSSGVSTISEGTDFENYNSFPCVIYPNSLEIQKLGCKNHRIYHDSLSYLPAPTNLQASAISWHQINLSWNGVNGATSYTIEKNIDNVWYSIANTSNTQYLETELSPNTTHHYLIRSKKDNEVSESYITASATTPAQ